jgi:hypothetical protein
MLRLAQERAADRQPAFPTGGPFNVLHEKMKKKIIKIGSVAALLLAGAVALTIWNGSGFRYIERETGVQLPGGCKNTKVFDNGCSYVLGYTQIEPGHVDDFLKRNQFTKLTEDPNPPASIRCFLKERGDFPPLSADENLWCRVGYHGKWPWEYLVNKTTGQLWTFVQYPDWAGD